MTNQDLNVALLPMNIVWGEKDLNLATLTEAIAKVHPLTDLLILPEMFSTGFMTSDKETIRPYAERNTGRTIDLLRQLAARYNMAIAGSFIADSGGSLYNRAFLIEPSGDETFADKRHLFTFAGEQKSFSQGYRRLAVRYRGWNIAMVVCYDIRFPVWCRNVNNEYDLLIAVANWPAVRENAWKALMPARAIENLSYLCAVNCKGTDFGGYEYAGASMAIDYKGKDISVSTGGEVIYATLSLDGLQNFRAKFPAWKDADSFKLL